MPSEQAIKRRCEEIKTLINQALPELNLQNAYISGGAIRDLLDDKTPKDWDIYFNTENDVIETRRILEAYRNRNPDLATETSYGNYNIKIQESPNQYVVVQFILAFWGTPSEMIKTFDFTINSSYYKFQACYLWLEAYRYSSFDHGLREHNFRLNKNLILCESPKSYFTTLWRAFRFVKEGYILSLNTYLQIMAELQRKPITMTDLLWLYGYPPDAPILPLPTRDEHPDQPHIICLEDFGLTPSMITEGVPYAIPELTTLEIVETLSECFEQVASELFTPVRYIEPRDSFAALLERHNQELLLKQRENNGPNPERY